MKWLLAGPGTWAGGVVESSERGMLIMTEGEFCCAMEEFALNDQLPMFYCERKTGSSRVYRYMVQYVE